MDAKKKDREQQLVRSPFVFALPFFKWIINCLDGRMQTPVTLAEGVRSRRNAVHSRDYDGKHKEGEVITSHHCRLLLIKLVVFTWRADSRSAG
jgi:hypothetical protein